MTVVAYFVVPCSYVQGRRGRCGRIATSSWKQPRVNRRGRTVYTTMHRCGEHPPRNAPAGTSVEPIQYRRADDTAVPGEVLLRERRIQTTHTPRRLDVPSRASSDAEVDRG